jgi:hypothetical protein
LPHDIQAGAEGSAQGLMTQLGADEDQFLRGMRLFIVTADLVSVRTVMAGVAGCGVPELGHEP